ncbi:MAG: hypothetical protein KBI10_06515 [Syntrophorhabdales bacterium]|nr:hypothetical protein [Syntrophorhabdales bacterium]
MKEMEMSTKSWERISPIYEDKPLLILVRQQGIDLLPPPNVLSTDSSVP